MRSVFSRYALFCGPLVASALVSLPMRADTVSLFAFTGGSQTFTASTTGVYDISAFGAQGGGGEYLTLGGLGAEIGGDFALTAGESLTIDVGGAGNSANPFIVNSGSGGGGGGSFVVVTRTQAPLVVAGGGGGGGTEQSNGGDALTGTSGGSGYEGNPGGTNGNGGKTDTVDYSGGGGGGFFGRGGSVAGGYGGDGGKPYLQGLAGGMGYSGDNGGFGGGGGAGFYGGGGGGGYSGGGGGSTDYFGGGGGGGSFLGTVADSLNTIELSGIVAPDGSTNGYVEITDLTPIAPPPTSVTPEPCSFLLLGTGLLGVTGVVRRRFA